MAIHQIQRVVRPKTVEEAWRVRREESGSSRFLAGGVDLVLYAPPTVTTLIDLGGLDLGGVRRDGDDLVIGAMATLSEVAESRLARGVADGFLYEVLRQVASPLQRNLATIGGAVVRAHPWSDVVTAFLALDARLEAFDGASHSFDLAAARDRRLEPFPLVVAIRLPGVWAKVEAAFEKFATTTFDVATLNCACSLRRDGRTCRDVRVVVGGTPALARRIPRAEQALEGRSLDADCLHGAARAAAESVDARDDRRATGAYRRRLTNVGVRRCFEKIAEGGGSA